MGPWVRCRPANVLAHEFEEVDSGSIVWAEVCYLQHVSVHRPRAKDAVAVASNLQFLGVGAKRRRGIVKAEGFDADGDAFAINRNDTIDVIMWPRQGRQIGRKPRPRQFTSARRKASSLVAPRIRTFHVSSSVW